MKKIISFVTLLVAFSLLLSGCGSQATPAPATQQGVPTNEVVAEARLRPVHGANLSFLVSGVVEQIFVKPGDTVKQGDVLVRLSNAGLAEAQGLLAQNTYDTLLRNESGDRAKLWKIYMDTQVARGKAEKKWDDLNLDDIKDNIETRKATVEDRQKDVTDAQEEFDKYKNVDENNSKYKDAKDKLDNAQDDLHQALRDLESEIRKRDQVRAVYDSALGDEAEAKHQYELSLDGPNADQLTLAKANLEAAKDNLANYVLIAPFDGVIADVSVKAGEQVDNKTRAVSVADFSQWVVETTDLTELEVVKLNVGQKVSLVPDALPDLTLKGTVTEIGNAYIQQGGDIIYTVRISIENPDPRLRWGMTLEATFAAPLP